MVQHNVLNISTSLSMLAALLTTIKSSRTLQIHHFFAKAIARANVGSWNSEISPLETRATHQPSEGKEAAEYLDLFPL